MPVAGEVLLERIKTFIIDPSVKVIFTLGLFLFFAGIIQFLYKLSRGEDTSQGKTHIIYGLTGMLIMVSVYGIISLIMNTLGIDFGTATDVSRIDNVAPNSGFFGN